MVVDPAIVAPILSTGVGLVGVVVAGLSVYFNYKGRHNQFRQVVYGKQMDAYFEITEAMAGLHNAAQNIIAFADGWLKGDDARKQFRTALREEHELFTGRVNRWLIVLPAKVKAALDHFNTALSATGAPAGADSPDPGGDLARAYE
jgi:hypothetical protein